MKDSIRHYRNSVADVLEDNPKIESGKPAVLLFDEIQSLRTKDEMGKEIDIKKYSDIWNLISDGKLPVKPDVDYILNYIYENRKIEKNGFFKKQKNVFAPSFQR